MTMFLKKTVSRKRPFKKYFMNIATIKALGIAWDLGYLIVLPIVIFGFAGAYADKYYSTSPLFLLIGIGLSLLITTIGIYRKMSTFIQTMNRKPNDKK